MSDLISRQLVMETLCERRCGDKPKGCPAGFCPESLAVDCIPSADVPDRKVGKWYDWSFKAFDGCTVWHRVCSVCGYKRDDDNLDKDTNYCPNCGAQMEEAGDDPEE